MISDEELIKKLKELQTEDYIWILYIGIIILSLYSKKKKKKYYVNNDLYSKKKYLDITVFIFVILVLVYSYFLKGSHDSFKNLKQTDSNKKKKLVTLSYVATILVFISGVIFLYVSLNNDNLDVELAFN